MSSAPLRYNALPLLCLQRGQTVALAPSINCAPSRTAVCLEIAVDHGPPTAGFVVINGLAFEAGQVIGAHGRLLGRLQVFAGCRGGRGLQSGVPRGTLLLLSQNMRRRVAG